MAKQKLKIVPVDEAGDSRTGTLEGISAANIAEVLGFEANVDDDPDKVKYSWGFTVNGRRCGIWDYYGSHKNKSFSTWGPGEVLSELFPGHYLGG